MRGSLFTVGGHLGAAVSALVDGQLAPADEERAWSHVMTCPGCRREVEREGQVKTRLATLRGEPPPPQLLGSLYDVRAWSAVDALERRERTRRRGGLAAAGAGSLGAAVLGLSALAGAPLGDTAPPPPVTSISGSSTGSSGGAGGPAAPAPWPARPR